MIEKIESGDRLASWKVRILEDHVEAFPRVLRNKGTLANILRKRGNKTNFWELGNMEISKISFREQGNKADYF